MSDVLVIGGGLAGLAASVALAESGLQVMLLESRPRLGGRASSFEDTTTGEVIDNCQHVAMGCCTNFKHFCRVTGLDTSFRRERELFFVEPPSASPSRPPRVCRFSAMPLPAPLHLAAALMRLSYLSLRDKWALARGLKTLAREQPQDAQSKNFAEWLAEQRQPVKVIERFWRVVLVSALSESLERISVATARKVFVDGFLTNRHGWEVWLPTVPLDELYSGMLTQWLATRGVDIHLKLGVERLLIENSRINTVKLRNGEQISAEHAILAVPHHRVLSLLPESVRTHPKLAGLGQLETAPIVSLHLWFDRPITSLPHATLVGRLSQWLFNRSRPEATGRTTHYYQVVISAAREVAQRPQADVIAEVVSELKAIWPESVSAELLHSRTVIEHKAVFSPLPGSDKLRPFQQSPIANLQLAGDWTCTGWPSTMEGAVRSGFLAAENVLGQLGRSANWLQPDVPVSPLSRWTFGVS